MNVFAFSLMLKKENLENSGVLVEMFSLNHLDFFIGPISLIRTGPTTRADNAGRNRLNAGPLRRIAINHQRRIYSTVLSTIIRYNYRKNKRFIIVGLGS